ncbi:MAG TPA: histidine kinase [Blastocatellia bacterium]|nr:histidine kinase [Blastocatellia bacterium]
MLKRGWVLWIFVLLAWTLVGLSYALNYYFFASHYGEIFTPPPTLAGMLGWELPYWFLWAALAPLIFKIARRYPLDRSRWLRNSIIHIAACLLFSFVHRAIYLVLGWLYVTVYQHFPTIPKLYRSDIFFNLPTGFMSYGTFMLISHVVDYYRRYQKEELRASRLKTELAEAQLEALKMQLHPHFLFNTLNSISALLDEDVEAADKMLTRLGDFLRLTLENSGAQQITLQEELEFLRCYLEIERVRFHDRLTVSIEIDPQTLDARVPNLILQPIVENAIRHGIVARAAAGRIEISSGLSNNMLRLQVKDNGPGLSSTQDSSGKLRGGFGLANTRARLEHLYGAAHLLEMSDAVEGGLLVALEIPFEKTSARAEQKVAVR